MPLPRRLVQHLQALRTAVATLEHPKLAARLAEIAGKPIELFNRALPETASKAIAAATTQALKAALGVALRTMHNEPKAASSYLQKALAATSGAVGGGFGPGSTSDRASDLHRHHAALHWRHCACRG
jgi:hypothetical protein